MNIFKSVSTGIVIALSINMNAEAAVLSLAFESSWSGGITMESSGWENETTYTVSAPIRAFVRLGYASHINTTYKTDYTVTPLATSYATNDGNLEGNAGYALNTAAYWGGNLLAPEHDYLRQTEANGVATSGAFSYNTGLSTINSPLNEFTIGNSIGGRYDYTNISSDGNSETILGSALYSVTENVKFIYDVDRRVDHLNYWTENTLIPPDYDGSFTQKLYDFIRSTNIIHNQNKNIYIKPKIPALGTRGSIGFDGTIVNTASPGISAYNFTLPDEDSFFLPFAFGENKDEATLEIFFEGELLGQAFGSDYELDELSFLELDLLTPGFSGSNGLLEFVLNTSGTESANLFIPETVAASAVPIPAAAWLFASGLLGLVGMARRRKA